ncbi:MAG: type II toxin-antitoxin system HipA family toxin [Kiloniellaceae bacterium]
MSAPPEAYVWTWLPAEVEPVVAGRLARQGEQLVFNYGRSYLARDDAIALFDRELPLKPGTLPTSTNMRMPACLRDSAPDAWGRKVILHLHACGSRAESALHACGDDELTFLTESGSDRIGALDFQRSPVEYVPRGGGSVGLEELAVAIGLLETGRPLTPELARLAVNCTGAGGARPKAVIESAGAKYLVKFSSSRDLYPVVKAEFVAMRLAARAGLNVAPVSLMNTADGDVLLVRRFDRIATQDGWQRRHMLSALTLLGLDEKTAAHASYEDLAEIIRHRFTSPKATLLELYGRMVFNVLIGNTDDHARNHAAFWDGRHLSLTPAFDICPQPRGTGEAFQAMRIAGSDSTSRIATCLRAAHNFLLSEADAIELIKGQTEGIVSAWQEVTAEAGLKYMERQSLWGRQILNAFAFGGLEGAARRSLSRYVCAAGL